MCASAEVEGEAYSVGRLCGLTVVDVPGPAPWSLVGHVEAVLFVSALEVMGALFQTKTLLSLIVLSSSPHAALACSIC